MTALPTLAGYVMVGAGLLLLGTGACSSPDSAAKNTAWYDDYDDEELEYEIDDTTYDSYEDLGDEHRVKGRARVTVKDEGVHTIQFEQYVPEEDDTDGVAPKYTAGERFLAQDQESGEERTFASTPLKGDVSISDETGSVTLTANADGSLLLDGAPVASIDEAVKIAGQSPLLMGTTRHSLSLLERMLHHGVVSTKDVPEFQRAEVKRRDDIVRAIIAFKDRGCPAAGKAGNCCPTGRSIAPHCP